MVRDRTDMAALSLDAIDDRTRIRNHDLIARGAPNNRVMTQLLGYLSTLDPVIYESGYLPRK